MIFFSSNFSHLSSHLLISSLVIRWQLGGSGSDGVSGREVVGGVPLGWAAGATCSEKSASPLHPFKWGFPLSFCLSIESNSSNPTCQERSPPKCRLCRRTFTMLIKEVKSQYIIYAFKCHPTTIHCDCNCNDGHW